jgi:hypothetical protein
MLHVVVCVPPVLPTPSERSCGLRPHAHMEGGEFCCRSVPYAVSSKLCPVLSTSVQVCAAPDALQYWQRRLPDALLLPAFLNLSCPHVALPLLPCRVVNPILCSSQN